MKHPTRPRHPYLPDDESRNIALAYVARARVARDPSAELLRPCPLVRHLATFRRVAARVLVTYTPTDRTNMQSSDWVNFPV